MNWRLNKIHMKFVRLYCPIGRKVDLHEKSMCLINFLYYRYVKYNFNLFYFCSLDLLDENVNIKLDLLSLLFFLREIF